jgi:hypothetical protein
MYRFDPTISSMVEEDASPQMLAPEEPAEIRDWTWSP